MRPVSSAVHDGGAEGAADRAHDRVDPGRDADLLGTTGYDRFSSPRTRRDPDAGRRRRWARRACASLDRDCAARRRPGPGLVEPCGCPAPASGRMSIDEAACSRHITMPRPSSLGAAGGAITATTSPGSIRNPRPRRPSSGACARARAMTVERIGVAGRARRDGRAESTARAARNPVRRPPRVRLEMRAAVPRGRVDSSAAPASRSAVARARVEAGRAVRTRIAAGSGAAARSRKARRCRRCRRSHRDSGRPMPPPMPNIAEIAPDGRARAARRELVVVIRRRAGTPRPSTPCITRPRDEDLDRARERRSRSSREKISEHAAYSTRALPKGRPACPPAACTRPPSSR